MRRKNAIELINALYDRNFDKIHDLLDNHDIELNYANAKNENALLLCLHFELREIALKILDKPNCGLNQIDKLKNNTLVFAIKKFYEDVAIKILNKGYKNINYIDAHGDNALSCALRYDQFKLIDKLMSYPNLDVNHIDNHGDSCLLIAIDSLKENIGLMILNKYKVNIDYVNKHGFNALILALTKLMGRLSTKLLDMGVKTSTRGNNGDTALIVALNKGFLEIAERINKETDSNNGNINEYGDIALFHCINTGNEKLCLEIFNKDRSNFDIVTRNGDTSLTIALTNNMYALSELLIDNGSNKFLKHINNNKDSGLFLTMTKNYWALAIKLINKRCYYENELNEEGDSILNYLINYGRDDLCMKILNESEFDVNLIFSGRAKLKRVNKRLLKLIESNKKIRKEKEEFEKGKEDVKESNKYKEKGEEYKKTIISMEKNIIELRGLKYSLEVELENFGNNEEGENLLMYAIMNDLRETSIEILRRMDSKILSSVNIYNDNVLFIATSKNRFEIVDEILYRDDVDINHIKDGKNILVILIGLDKWNLVERILRREDLDKDKMSENGINIGLLLTRKKQTYLLSLIK